MPTCSTCQHSWQCFTRPISPLPLAPKWKSSKFVFDTRLWDNIANPIVCQIAKLTRPSSLALSDLGEYSNASASFRESHPLAGVLYHCNVRRLVLPATRDTADETPRDLAGKVLVYPSSPTIAYLSQPGGLPVGVELACLLMPIESIRKVSRIRPPFNAWYICFYSPFATRNWWILRERG